MYRDLHPIYGADVSENDMWNICMICNNAKRKKISYLGKAIRYCDLDEPCSELDFNTMFMFLAKSVKLFLPFFVGT